MPAKKTRKSSKQLTKAKKIPTTKTLKAFPPNPC